MHDRDEDLILTLLSLLPVADAGKVMLLKDHMSVFCMVDNPTPTKTLILSIEHNERFRSAL